MIQKSAAEKAQLKAAKRAYKNNNKIEPLKEIDLLKITQPNYILTGIMANEDVLPDDYPVYWDYLYVVEIDGGKVIRSDIHGTVSDLKTDLHRCRGYINPIIRRCNMTARNIY